MIKKDAYLFKVNALTTDRKFARLSIDNLALGEGYSLGTALRRTLLNSLSGNAVVAISLPDITTYGQNINGAVEDSQTLFLALREFKIKNRTNSEEPFILEASMDDKDCIKFGDFKPLDPNVDIEILDPERVLLHKNSVSKEKSLLTIKLLVEYGVGFTSIQRDIKQPVDVVGYTKDSPFTPIDANYSPIIKVNSFVKEQEHSMSTECLVLEVTTDGTRTPFECITMSAEILQKSFAHIHSVMSKLSVFDSLTGIVSTEPLSFEDIKSEEELEEIIKAHINEADEKYLEALGNRSSNVQDINTIVGLAPAIFNILKDSNIQTTDQIDKEMIKRLFGEVDKEEVIKGLSSLGIKFKEQG